MAHWARINDQNIVIEVICMDNDMPNEGEDWIAENLEGHWLKTSYNTISNTHRLGGMPFRKNYAGIGYLYDSQRDAFIRPRPNEKAILDEETCDWIIPEED